MEPIFEFIGTTDSTKISKKRADEIYTEIYTVYYNHDFGVQ